MFNVGHRSLLVTKQRLVSNPPPVPSSRLTSFLSIISQAFPKVFYKPIFSCAAATKEKTVINQLLVLNAISQFVPDLWTRDAEMLSFALMSGSASHSQKASVEGPVWGKSRLGQSALLLEIIHRLSSIRNSKDMSQVGRVFTRCSKRANYTFRLQVQSSLQQRSKLG